MTSSPSDQEAVQELLRALRGRVPVDAAELLAQEPPERIEAVLRALPNDFALRIAFELPEALRPAGTVAIDVPVPGQVSELSETAKGVLKRGTTVAAARKYLRAAEGVADITYLYVVDDQNKFQGGDAAALPGLPGGGRAGRARGAGARLAPRRAAGD
jgi:Mg/Co/Ni transporter MgtE